ncbi:MAG: hypothetical protein WCH34_03120 [Bacteroidota bacterium]
MKKTLPFLFLFSLVVFFVSCKKDKTPPADIPNTGTVLSTSLAGFGSYGGVPSGTPYVFPSNIKLVGEILGGNPGKSPFIGKKSIEAWQSYISNSPKSNWVTHGLGEFVTLYMRLYNTSGNASTFVFPAGLMFTNKCPGDTTIIDTTQTGIIVIPDTVTVPGGDTLDLCLKSYCCNPHRGVPNATTVYTAKAVSNNDQIVHFIAALKGKTTLVSHESDILTYVWSIANGVPLTAADYATIAAW